jgi:hypothetical protein
VRLDKVVEDYLSQYPITSPAIPNAHFIVASGYLLERMTTRELIRRMADTVTRAANIQRSLVVNVSSAIY